MPPPQTPVHACMCPTSPLRVYGVRAHNLGLCPSPVHTVGPRSPRHVLTSHHRHRRAPRLVVSRVCSRGRIAGDATVALDVLPPPPPPVDAACHWQRHSYHPPLSLPTTFARAAVVMLPVIMAVTPPRICKFTHWRAQSNPTRVYK
jgi:hypothetical protein